MNTVLVIAGNTISEAMRRKILLAFLMVGLAVIVFMFAFSTFTARQELTLIKGMGLGIISLAGLFISVILSIYLIPTELERRTIYTILSKPVTRSQFLLGKYLGAIGTVAINILAMGLLFIAAVAVKQSMAGQPVDAGELFKGVLMTLMQMILLCSLSVFLSVFTPPLINFFGTLSLFIIGSMSAVTYDLAKSQTNNVAKAFFTGIHYIVPNFGNFTFTNPLLNPEVQVQNPVAFLVQNCIYAIVYSAVLLILAVLVFDRKEV